MPTRFHWRSRDLPLEAHQALVMEILSGKRDVPSKKYSVGPLLQYSKGQPDEPFQGESSGCPPCEHMIEHAGGCRDFYDPVAEYMEGLGEGNDWLHPYFEDHFVCHCLLLLSMSFLSIKHNKRTKLLGKLLDWLYWKSDFT